MVCKDSAQISRSNLHHFSLLFVLLNVCIDSIAMPSAHVWNGMILANGVLASISGAARVALGGANSSHVIHGRGRVNIPDWERKVLLIGFLPALTGGNKKYFRGAFPYALDTVNTGWSKHEVLKHYKIDYIVKNNKGDTEESIRAMTSMYFNDTIAFIGPDDTCATEARIAAAWNLPMIAVVSNDLLLSNRFLEKTPYFYSLK